MSSTRSSIEWQFRAEDAIDALRMRTVVRAFFVAEADDASDIDGAVLVFGELVANVVRHAPGAISVRIDWPAAGPAMLYVDDWGPGVRSVCASDDPLREDGRGIQIVRALARDLHIVSAPFGGTHVSAALPVDRRDSAAA
ncbi:MAG: ATP-binding protein [Candidatus Eremiobacteraeota bacterium]|nr:ATP-binding protein [Candidatus Eremiobacteraeota bacterium]